MEGKSYLFDRSIEHERPPTAITLRGEIFGTLGNFSLVIGKAKSRKTFFLTSLVAAATSSTEINNFRSELPENHNGVQYIDTEQGNYHISRVDDRIARLKNATSNNFEIHALRAARTAERLKYVEECISNCKNLGLVIIDGIRDLVNDINCPKEATEMSDKLLRLTADYNIHIVVVLHQNKGNEHARGHLGTELQNKAETVVSVTVHPKDKELSVVELEMSRNKPFDEFGFRIDFSGLPQLADIPTERNKSATTPETVGDESIIDILRSAYKNCQSYTATQLNTIFMDELKVGASKARVFVKYSNDQNFIDNISKASTKYNYELSKTIKESGHEACPF